MNIQQTTPTPKLVTMIPADPQMAERDLRKKHLRVAPYCRVSTDRIKKKFGKNAILKGMNLEDGATARERNQTIGGHQA